MSLRGLSVVLVLVMSAGMANASVVLSDSFTYSDGNLVGQGGWLQTGATATNPIQVSSGKAALVTSGQDIYVPLTSSVPHTDGNSVYTSVKLNLSAAQATGDYIVHLSDPVGTTSNFYERLFARSSGAGYQIGLLASSGTGSSTTWGTTVLSFATDYNVVTAWNFVTGIQNDTYSLYVDPTDAVEGNNTPYLTHTWNSTSVSEPAQITAANLRQGTAANAPTGTVDNLMVTTSFAEVVPEPASLGLLAMSLLALRRRR